MTTLSREVARDNKAAGLTDTDQARIYGVSRAYVWKLLHTEPSGRPRGRPRKRPAKARCEHCGHLLRAKASPAP